VLNVPEQNIPIRGGCIGDVLKGECISRTDFLVTVCSPDRVRFAVEAVIQATLMAADAFVPRRRFVVTLLIFIA